MNEEQIAELKALVDELESQGLSTADIQSKVDQRKAEFAETVEVTDEIQTTPTEGKTNGAVAKGATATPVTGQAPESTESELEESFLVPPSRFVDQGQYLKTKEGIQYAEKGSIALAEPKEDTFAPVMLDEVVLTAEQFKERQAQEENQAARNLMLKIAGIQELSEEQVEEQILAQGDIKPITEFEETQRISAGDIEFRKRKEERAKRIEEGEEDLSFAESTLGTLVNGLEQLSSLDDQFSYLYNFAGTLGYDLNANLFGEDYANKVYEESLMGMGKAKARIDEINSLRLPTQSFYNLGQKKNFFGKIGGGFAAALDGAGSLATSVISTPAGLGVQIASGSIKNFNDTKAQELGISTEELFRTNQAEITTPFFLGAVEFLSEKARIKGIDKYIRSIPTGARKEMADLLKIGGSNFTQEWFQGGISELNTNLAKGMSLEQAGIEAGKFMTSKQGLEQGLKGMFGATGVAASGKVLTANYSIRTSAENKRLKEGLRQLNSLESAKFAKNITADEIATINTSQQEIISNLKNQYDENEILVSSLTEEQLNIIQDNADFLTESASRINKIEASEDLSRQDKDVIINTIQQARDRANQEIYNVRNEGEAFVNELRKARKAVEPLQDVEIVDFENTQQVENFLQQQDQNLDTKASEEQAFVIQNPETGKQTVVINRGVAAKEAIRHEVGHVLLYETVKNNPETAINLGNALLSELNKIDPAQVKDSNFKKRMEQYADSTRAVQMEEAITLFSDAINTGDIKFNENIFTKLGDSVRRTMQRFGVNIKFDNGRDVYNFVKDYNKSLEKGGLSLAQVQAAAKGVEGELVTPAEQQPEKQVIKESKIYQEVETFKDDLVNQETKDATAFLIADKLENEVDRRLKIDVDPETKEDIVRNFLFDDRRGLLGLLQGYDPARNESIMGYLNSSTPGGKLLDARLIEFYENDPRYNQIIQSTTDEAVQRRAEQVTAEEVTVAETPTKPEAKAIDPFRIMPDVKETATAEVQKSIADKDIDVTTVTYKELKDAAPYQTVADFFNIPVSRIKNPKDNLRKSDNVANIQRWILKNEPTLKNLFTEANREVVEIKEGNRVVRKGGEPTAIPRNLLNKFYTKGERVGNNFQWKLKPYDRNTFLEAVGIKDGKVDPNFTPRAAEAQTIKGILDMYTRNLGNVIARETIEAREDIAPAEKARAKAEVAKGKPRLMFSKNIDTNIEDNRFSQIYFAYERGEALADKDKQIVEDYIAKQALEESDKGKSALQFTKAMKASDLPSNLKEGTWTLSDKKFKEDPNALKEFNKQADDLSSQIPLTANIANKNRNIVLGLFAGHYNIVGSDMAKIGSDFKQGILNNLNTDESSVLSKETLDRWEKFPWDNLKSSYASENYTGLRKINESNSFKEQQTIARETFNNKQGKASLELYDLWNTTLQEWLYSSRPGSKEFNDKANYILKLKKSNASIGTTGERILAPPGYVFLPGQAINGTVKFEHLKSSSQQSGESTLLVLQNKWKDEGKDNIKAYNGIWGLLDDFNIIDEQTGKVNDSSIFRFAENLELAKSIYSVESNFTKTLYDDIVKKVGEKFVKQFESDQNKLFNFNNDKLPVTIKLSKSKTTPDVLETMESLDNKAKEANKNLFDSADLNKGFNDILEQTTGIASEKRYKRVKAEVAGAAKGRAIRGIPYSAQDFVGLLYETLSKGKLGDSQMAWYKENLIKPYAKAMNEIDAARLSMMQDYRNLKKELKLVPKNLRKKIPGEPFTREQAVRVYIWNQQGMKVPGISEADLKDLTDYVNGDRELQVFANQLIYMQKGDEYAKPKEGWPAGSITTDLLESINTVKRAKYLEQWKANKDVIFSEENMNKLEAAYGKKYRVALENMLERMQSGRNRRFSDDSLTGRFTDWLQGSIGTIMFFNTRSALLQTISSINFVNFTDNNPFAAAKAFSNQKQYWSDFSKLINSDFLKARRSGLRMNVNEADIADMAKKGGPRAVINKLLQLGFAPTQIADSFAIASGGATFYRNRINTYKKQGLSQQEAETKAFEDFRENAEESQQSARPDRISMQQAGPLGRLILAFQNTPSQYARIIDKSVRDLKNNRGDVKTNISKIIYYSTVQNLLFNALQQALFAFAFDDEEPEDKEKEEKYVNIANGMMDSLLRGTGVAGGVMSVLKNAILRIVRESEKDRPKYEKVGADLIKIAPPVSSKLSKINQAARSYEWDKEEMKEKGWSLDNPAYLAGANVISALTNVPLDRGIKKANNVVNATDSDLETWERLALLGGWQDWEIGVNEETKTNKPQPRKTKPKSRKTKTRKTTTR